MILGRVVGAVWATRKHAKLAAYKLLLVRPYFYYNPTHALEQLVAVDTLDAGVGDDVIVCLGAPARQSLGDIDLPVDAAVLGVVDACTFAADAFAADAPTKTAPRRLRFIGGRRPNAVSWT